MYVAEAEPGGEEERQIYESVGAVLDKGPEILDQLFDYTGCEEHIRKVITKTLQYPLH
jgi:hypothetical protein